MRVLIRVVWAAAAGCVVGALAGWGAAQALHIPQVDQLASSYQPAATTRVLGADGSLVASFALERRIVLRPEEIPDSLKLAIVAIEDADFYNHGGVDPSAIVRAAWVITKNLLHGRKRLITQGGSTLTQQLARDLFRMKERTLERKIKEALLAIDLEKRFSKDQILTMYANQVYLGHGAYGVEAAARLYFGKPAKELTVAEAALLAGMIQNPERLRNPISNPEGALSRRNQVLKNMRQLGFIDDAAYEEAVAQPLGAALHHEGLGAGAYFVEEVRQQLDQRYGSQAVYTDGLEVHTTMDPVLQRAAQKAVREGLVELDMSQGFRKPSNVVAKKLAASPEAYQDPSWRDLELEPRAMVRAVVTVVTAAKAELVIGHDAAVLPRSGAKWTGAQNLTRILHPGDLVLVRLPDPLPEGGEPPRVELLQEPALEGALLALDNQTGAVLALVGGYDFERSEFNRAIQAKRQCGSAFKPFVYLTAFEQGYTPADTLFDAPFLLPDAHGDLTYCPKNYYGKYYGITTLRRALELSHNATAVKLQQLVGGDAVVDLAHRFGITTPLHPYATLALGALEVRLIDLVRAYAGFADLGSTPDPFLIESVVDRNGTVRERTFPTSHQAAPPAVDYLLLNVLRGVVERGTGMAAASLPAHLAGKTGTTDDYTDAWFIGFSPRITVGVWVGHDLKKSIGRRMTGAKAALPIWMKFMQAYLDGLPEEERAEDFRVPAGVVFTPIDLETGLRAIPSCPKVILESFLDGTEPTESCSDTWHQIIDLPWPLQQPYYTPRPLEPMPTPEALAVADERATSHDE